MIKYIVSALLIISFSNFGDSIEDCGSKSGVLENITVTGCDDLDQRCILKRNTEATVAMEFKTNQDITNVTSVVHGIVLGVPVPFNLPNPDGCKDSGLICPLQKDHVYTYHATLPIEKKYPKVTVDVKWELRDNNNNDILCVIIPAKVQ